VPPWASERCVWRPGFNAARTVELMEQAGREQAVTHPVPELAVAACDDLFHQSPAGRCPRGPADVHRVGSVALVTRWGCRCRSITCSSLRRGAVPGTLLGSCPSVSAIRGFMSCGSSPRRPGHARHHYTCVANGCAIWRAFSISCRPDARLTFFVEICRFVGAIRPPATLPCSAAFFV